MSDFNSIFFQAERPLLKEITANRLNTILAEIRRNKPKGERGITVRQSGDGTYIGLATGLGRGGAVTDSHPFKISSRKDPENENGYLVSVVPGTLNDLLPTNTFTAGQLTQFPVGSNSVSYVKLVGETDGTHQFVSCEIIVDDEQAQPQIPTAFVLPTNPEFLLGVVLNGSAYNTVVDSLVLSGQVQLTTDRDEAPLPGELPYVSWYVWAP